MNNSYRINEILKILQKKKQISNNELAKLLHCSLSTLRRDLLQLEQELLIKRVHGGVILNTSTNIEYGHTYRENENRKDKQKISELAIDFIDSNMCLFFDSSSTVQFICPLVQNISNLIIVTNGLKTAYELSKIENDSLKIYLMGGEFKKNTNSIFSPYEENNFFDNFKFDIAFFSCRGVSLDGVYEADLLQAQFKRKIMNQSKNSILLVNSNKFNSEHFFKINNWEKYSTVLSDSPIPTKYQQILQNKDIDFIWYDNPIYF